MMISAPFSSIASAVRFLKVLPARGDVTRAGCAAYADYLTSDARRARVLCIEVAGISRHMDNHRLKMRRRFAQLILESSQRLRDVAFDPGIDLGVVATLLTGAADALMSEWVLSRKPSVPTLIDTLTTVWMRSLQLDHLEQLMAGRAVVVPPLAPGARDRRATGDQLAIARIRRAARWAER